MTKDENIPYTVSWNTGKKQWGTEAAPIGVFKDVMSGDYLIFVHSNEQQIEISPTEAKILLDILKHELTPSGPSCASLDVVPKKRGRPKKK